MKSSKISSLLNAVYNSVEKTGGVWGVYSCTMSYNTSWGIVPARKTLLNGYESLGDAWQAASEGGRYVLFVNK